MKKFRTAIIVLGLLVLLNGCSTLNSQGAMSSNIAQEVKVSEVTQTEVQKGGKGQQTDPADLAGEISEIIGNEITLKIVKMPQMAERPQQSETQQADTKEAEKSAPKAITGSTDTGGRGFGGGGFPGGPPGETSTNANAQSNKVAIKLDYTGEEKTMTIPVGMGITSGRGQTEITFETLEKGNVLSIWQDDSGTVEKARLISGGTK